MNSRNMRIAALAAFLLGVVAGASWAWADQHMTRDQPAQVIRGLGGGDYEPYKQSVIKKVQEVLKEKGLYAGEVNGRLDDATMKALGECQRNSGLQVSGVPTPGSRAALLAEAAAGAPQSLPRGGVAAQRLNKLAACPAGPLDQGGGQTHDGCDL